jgi:ATP-dependent RNA helicase DeaD
MDTFADLKIDADLVDRLEQLGYKQPTALQKEAVAAIGRGTSAVGLASAGSGLTLAYGLGLAPRLDAGDPDLQALILLPTDDRAAAVADALHQLLSIRGLRVGTLGPGAPGPRQLATASPAAALAALEHSAIKLDSVRALIVDGAAPMIELGAGPALETLIAQIPKDAQRIVLSPRLTPEVEGWIERHARRARQLAYLPAEPKTLANVGVEFFAGRPDRWMPVLMGVLAGKAGDRRAVVSVHCRRPAEARELADRLQVRGIEFASAPEEAGVWIETGFPGASPPGSLSVSWGVPPDYVSFHARVADADRALIFLEPRQLAHLHLLALTGAARLTALRSAPPPEAGRSAQLTRDQLREAATQRDLDPYMLLIEPLLEELTPVQIAAAATALLRERAPAPQEEMLPAWTRLYFNVGRRDGVRPADLVGAITGETSITGDSIGRIEIRDTHTSVEVAATVAEKLMKGLATATIRGRPANVRVFRE